MKYCVFGAGLMGKAVVYDLFQDKDTTSVLALDNDIRKLDELKKFICDERLHLRIFDANDPAQLEDILKECNAAVAAIHYKYNECFTEIAIKAKTHLCDLGGNSEVVDKQLKLNAAAKKAGISVIPDCGLAPGMVSVLVRLGLEKYDWADTVKIMVGGLPQKPKGILKYGRLFSVEGLINEYIEPVRVLRNGKTEIIEPLAEIEEIEFPGFNVRVHCNAPLEAFTTSGGVSTLIETYKNRLKNLDYKTIRYKGHCNIMRAFYELGFFHGEARKLTAPLFEKFIPLCKEDVTLVKIIFEGKSKKHELNIIDYAKDGFTSMMRMTAFPAAIIAKMQAKGLIEAGVLPQEKCVPVKLFISELAKRQIVIS